MLFLSAGTIPRPGRKQLLARPCRSTPKDRRKPLLNFNTQGVASIVSLELGRATTILCDPAEKISSPAKNIPGLSARNIESMESFTEVHLGLPLRRGMA
jgi:hypothetical protein